MIVNWLGGTVHAAGLTARYRDRTQPSTAQLSILEDRPALSDRRGDDAVRAAQMTLARRHEARRIVEADLPLAAELRIGRPDLPRSYDDGGLVDVNHIPVEHLIAALEMQPGTADEVIRARSIRNGFTSADDMLIALRQSQPRTHGHAA